MDRQSSAVSHLNEDQVHKIVELCKQYKVEKLYLFGSILTDSFKADSDIDLLVSFQPMDLLEYADNFFGLQEALEKKLHRKVDLVIEKDLSNPVLINSIIQNRELIYEKEEDRKVVA